MTTTLILIGAFCVIAAIVGGGLTLTNIGTMPVVDSVRRQVMLALFGVAVIVAAVALSDDDSAPSGKGTTEIGAVLPSLDRESVDETALELLPSTGRPGSLVRVSGRGFEAGERVVIEFGVHELGSTTADTRGRFFNKRVRIPRDHQFAGKKHIVATGESSIRHTSRPIDIKCRKGDKQMGPACFAPGTLRGPAP